MTLKKFWESWSPEIAIAISLVAVLQTCVSVRHASTANNLTKQALAAGERPWFELTAIRTEDLTSNSYRFVGTLKHFSGGPALDMSFRIGINQYTSSVFHLAALLPNDQVTLLSHIVHGPHPTPQDDVHYYFRFKDSSGLPYHLEQVVQLRSNGLKQVSYIPHQE
jgi:hypothetical protein